MPPNEPSSLTSLNIDLTEALRLPKEEIITVYQARRITIVVSSPSIDDDETLENPVL